MGAKASQPTHFLKFRLSEINCSFMLSTRCNGIALSSSTCSITLHRLYCDNIIKNKNNRPLSELDISGWLGYSSLLYRLEHEGEVYYYSVVTDPECSNLYTIHSERETTVMS